MALLSQTSMEEMMFRAINNRVWKFVDIVDENPGGVATMMATALLLLIDLPGPTWFLAVWWAVAWVMVLYAQVIIAVAAPTVCELVSFACFVMYDYITPGWIDQMIWRLRRNRNRRR